MSTKLAFLKMPFIELEFKIRGVSIGANYLIPMLSEIRNLLSSHQKQDFESAFDDILISRIVGCPDFNGQILLSDQSTLRIRVPESILISVAKHLNGAIFDLNGHRIRLDRAKLTFISASSSLHSRLVTFDSITNGQSELDRLTRLSPIEFEKLLRSSLSNLGILY